MIESAGTLTLPDQARDARLEQALAENARLKAEKAKLEAEKAKLEAKKAELETRAANLEAENQRLRHKLDLLSRELYGKKAEKVSPSELQQAAEQARETPEPSPPPHVHEAPDVEEKPKKEKKPKKPGHGRRPLSTTLPRRRVEINPPPEELRCKQCGAEKRRLGEEISETAEFVPASIVIIETVRPKWRCTTCEGEFSCAPLPATPIERGRPGPGLLAHVITSKYCDHLPLHRQEQILARHGLEISRSTLCDWVDDVANMLRPVQDEIARNVLRSPVVGTDETSIRVLDKEAPGGSRKGSMWLYRGEPGDVVLVHTATKAGDGPAKFLAGWKGFLQADAASVFDKLYESGEIVEVGCNAHARRKFFNAKDVSPTEAGFALAFYQKLYAVEADAKERGLAPSERLALRTEKSAPLVKGFYDWLEPLKLAVVPKSPLATAVNYALNHRKALCRFLEDGRLELDNNNVERALRQIAVGRRNWLFAGSAAGAERGAVLYSLVVSCRELGIDPFEYLRDVVSRLSTHPQSRIFELTPRGWRASRRAAEDAKAAAQASAAPST